MRFFCGARLCLLSQSTEHLASIGRSHRWTNLWITDASVFPSSGGGEAESLTIQALALRTADLLAQSG